VNYRGTYGFDTLPYHVGAHGIYVSTGPVDLEEHPDIVPGDLAWLTDIEKLESFIKSQIFNYTPPNLSKKCCPTDKNLVASF